MKGLIEKHLNLNYKVKKINKIFKNYMKNISQLNGIIRNCTNK